MSGLKQSSFRRFFSTINHKNLFFTILGSALVAFGTSIHVDSNAVDGGVIGLARLIEHFTDGKVEIWLSSLLINAFCYLLAWRLMDAKFIFNMGFGTLTYSLFVKMFEPIRLDLGDYMLLATFVGMVFIECGTGLMLRYGSSPNGEHVLSVAIVEKGDFDFGWFSLIKDFIVILLFIPFTDFDSVIYSLILTTLTIPIVEYIVTAPKKAGVRKTVSKKKGNWIAVVITGIVIVAVISGITMYLGNLSKADTNAIYLYNAEYIEHVETKEFDDDVIAYVPEGEIKAGFVFYPGGQVKYTSYEPLLKSCAEQGILCIVVKMPQNLAIFGINKATKATELFPEVENWYVGGHSLGGSMAAACASNHDDIFKGVILLAAYSTRDITNLEVLSIYGDHDGVLTQSKYNKNKDNLPADFTEYVINGGNHAYFGMYGEQKNDGEATITNIEQINITAQKIAEFINK